MANTATMVTLNGKPLTSAHFCLDCGVEDGSDFHPEMTENGYPMLLARLEDGLCQFCWDMDQVNRGKLAPCVIGLTAHSVGCGCP